MKTKWIAVLILTVALVALIAIGFTVNADSPEKVPITIQLVAVDEDGQAIDGDFSARLPDIGVLFWNVFGAMELSFPVGETKMIFYGYSVPIGYLYPEELLLTVGADGSLSTTAEHARIEEVDGVWVITVTLKKIIPDLDVDSISFNSDSPAYNASTNTFTVSESYPLIITVSGNELENLTSNYRLHLANSQGVGATISSYESSSTTVTYMIVKDTMEAIFKLFRDNNRDENVVAFSLWSQMNVFGETDLNIVVGSEQTITVTESENGKVTVSAATKTVGDTATITVTPDEGYVLDSLTVTDKEGKAVTVDENNRFAVPEGGVNYLWTKQLQYADAEILDV